MKDVQVNGTQYNGVSTVELPLADGSGMAEFEDIDEKNYATEEFVKEKIAEIPSGDLIKATSEYLSQKIFAGNTEAFIWYNYTDFDEETLDTILPLVIHAYGEYETTDDRTGVVTKHLIPLDYKMTFRDYSSENITGLKYREYTVNPYMAEALDVDVTVHLFANYPFKNTHM